MAQSLNIPLVSIDSVNEIDLTIDGADEVDRNLQGIKGGGGALLYEKIVASASRKIIWVVDASKMGWNHWGNSRCRSKWSLSVINK